MNLKNLLKIQNYFKNHLSSIFFFKKIKTYSLNYNMFWDIFNFNSIISKFYTTSKFNLLFCNLIKMDLYINMLTIMNTYKYILVKDSKQIDTIFSKLILNKQTLSLFTKIYKNLINTILQKILILINIIVFNLKWLLIALIISVLYFFVSIFYIQINFTKQVALWYILLIIFYLLMSNFNSFLNKYRYGKFTSSIQRFWKRTGMVFWLIEGFLFLLFFYYYLNSSQEPLYMFDYSNLNQELLIQLKSSYKNMILLSLAIFLSFILILNLNYMVFSQSIVLLMLISLIVFYTLFIETYQFAYIINLFADKNWIFEETKQVWALEIEQNNLRVKQQYFVLCLVAKYWHFIFIFISWFFFLIKSIEVNKISYTMLGYNTQNLLILYVLNLMCLIQWFKFFSKKFLELTYYWFHIQYDEKFFIMFINEIVNVFMSILSLNNFTNNLENFLILSNKILYCNELNLWKFI